jgi:hypothetical protein
MQERLMLWVNNGLYNQGGGIVSKGNSALGKVFRLAGMDTL